MSGSPARIDLREIAPQAWKNGAGLTREIAFGGPGAADFDWRISVAEVARDAPFSA
ncbi:MAG TPA: HutD family protein, partial [Burkholderiaceae bacterium]